MIVFCDCYVSPFVGRKFNIIVTSYYSWCHPWFITTVAGAVVADLIPDERRGEGTGYYVTSMNIAIIGPFIGIFISGKFSYQMVFTIGTIVALLDLISALLKSARG